MKSLIVAAALLSVPALAQGQPPVPAPAAPPATQAAPAEIDPQRLALARITAAAMFPDGSYERMMSGSMDSLMDGMMGTVMDMELGDMLPKSSGADREMQEEIEGKTLRELAAQEDPHFEERMRITNRVLMTEMIPIMTRLEPAMREGLARSYARKFSDQQLIEMNRFFATPTGRAFAAESLLVWMDPDTMKSLSGLAPALVAEMPAIMEKLAAATAHLPPPPKPDPDREQS